MSSNQQVTDYIYYYPNALDSKICNNIINHYDTNAKWKQSSFSTHNKNTGTSKVVMDEYWIPEEGSYDQDLQKAFSKIGDDYANTMDHLRFGAYTMFRLNRYSGGGFMKQHIDSIHHSHGQQYGYPHCTSLIFLNDNYDGGEFVLCGNKSIEKKQGSGIVFPSNFMYPHEVKEVSNGTRFSVMTWIM